MTTSRKADEVLYATSPTAIPSLYLSRHGNFAAGMISGTLGRVLTTPLDVIKLFIQVGANGGSIIETTKDIYARKGIGGFWTGSTISVVNQGFYSAIKFLILREFASLKKGHVTDTSESTYESAITGGIAGVISQAAVFPMDLVRTRIILNPDKYHTFFQTAAIIVKEEGFTALWSGLKPTVIGSIPYESSQYLVYSQLRQRILKRTHKPLTSFQNAILGTAAGMISATIAYPFENLRKLMMCLDGEGKKKYSSMTKCLKHVMATEGISGLYHGVVLNAFKAIPYSALQFTLYDEVCHLFIKMKLYTKKDKI
ncbi:hypothetical protein M9Y10_039160 [Tritrichomonas musculus]|uniref:Mitochondrial carrier protein n=1 Tax=Tritrichomonas musculus TaxID=1915356 RepID=A0ABR2KAK4_9EUKA